MGRLTSEQPLAGVLKVRYSSDLTGVFTRDSISAGGTTANYAYTGGISVATKLSANA